MGLEFLARIRRGSIALGLIAALFAASYLGAARGLGVAAGVAWSLVNLWLLERLVVALTGPDRGEIGGLTRAATALGGLLALFGAGAALLLKLPLDALAAGFTVPFVVMVLKAASLLLLGSRAWRRFTRDPRRTAVLLLALAVTAWAAAPMIARATQPGASPTATTTVAQATPAEAQTAHQAEHAAPAAETGAERAGAAHGEGEHGGEQGGPQKFANLITVIVRAFPDASWAHFLHRFEVVIFALLVALLLCIVSMVATRNPQMVPTPLQNLVELLVEGLYRFTADILGEKHAARYVPFLGTLGLYIWCMNLFGLIPFMDSPTSSLNVTFALGLVVFVYAQWIGIRGLGPIGYVDHMLGQPRDLTGWVLAPLMLPIHLLGELAKPISLSCRLFGNIFGEDMLLVAFVTLGISSVSFLHLPIGLPLQLPFLLLALLTSTLQAAVFMVLATIYILLMLPHAEHVSEEALHHSH